LFATLLAMLWRGSTSYTVVVGGLLSFFVAFNILEAMLPSMISRIAPARTPRVRRSASTTRRRRFGLFLSAARWAAGWSKHLRRGRGVPLRHVFLVALWLVGGAHHAGGSAAAEQAATAPAPPHGILEPKS
jgi:hypothetical protein